MKNDSLNSPWEEVGEIYPKGRRLDIENEFFMSLVMPKGAIYYWLLYLE